MGIGVYDKDVNKMKTTLGGNFMMMNLMQAWRKFARDVKGQGMVEYALLVGLIAIVVIVALVLLGPAIANMFNDITNAL